MRTPVEITFNGVEKSAAIEARIAEKVAALERRFARMTHCRVVIEAPHRRSKLGKLFHVQIEIGVPGRAPVIVRSDREENHQHEDLAVALRDAFDAARRLLDEKAAKLAAAAKAERGRRRPTPDSKVGDH
jgi:ribosome-associated translation inhibitor RaiA